MDIAEIIYQFKLDLVSEVQHIRTDGETREKIIDVISEVEKSFLAKYYRKQQADENTW